jgi:hypothetical protein
MDTQECDIQEFLGGGCVMRIGYLTLDEVNENLAQELAARFHIRLERLSFCDDAAVQCCDALLYEVDFLAPGDRERLLARLIDRSGDAPVAVHGFHLCRRETRFLRGSGIKVFRRLETKVFRQLIRDAREHVGSGRHPLTSSH